MCLPSLSKTHLDGYMTRPDAGLVIKQTFRGRIRKERPFFLFSLLQRFFFGSFVIFNIFFFQCGPGQLDVHFSRGLLPAGRASNYTRERGWGFRLMKCRK